MVGPAAARGRPFAPQLEADQDDDGQRGMHAPEVTTEAPKMNDVVDVAIVGAGPVGLLLALLLHRRGVSVAIYDRQLSKYPLPRAVCLDHESHRILYSAGLKAQLDELLQRVCHEPGKSFAWRDAEGEMIVDLFWERPSISGFDRAYGFSQPDLEGALEAAVVKAGVPFYRGLELRSFDDDGSKVTARLSAFSPKCPVSSATVEAKYLVGCDGANSTVRGLADIVFKDLGFEYDWLVCDLIPLNGHVPPLVDKFGAAQFCDPERPTTLVFAGKGRKRLEFMRMPHETKEQLFCDESAWRLVKKWGYDPSNCQLERTALYTFRARWAERWSSGRIILAGDAAHQTPPFIGQGMNSGLRDAASLGWRLPAVLQEGASPKLFETYTNERLAHMQSLIHHCVNLGKAICLTDPVEAKKVHTLLRENPPPDGFDPPLGRPGVLKEQDCSGHLSLQREVRRNDGVTGLFDDVFGVGWRLIATKALPQTLESSAVLRQFAQKMQGAVVSLGPDNDLTGEYQQWLDTDLQADVVLVRPDFYVFGTSTVADVEQLVASSLSHLFE